MRAFRATAYPSTSCARGRVSDDKRHHDHSPRAQGKTMAEHEETRQEKETRWTAQRAAHDAQQQEYRAARRRRIGTNWLVIGALVIIVAVIATAMLLK